MRCWIPSFLPDSTGVTPSSNAILIFFHPKNRYGIEPQFQEPLRGDVKRFLPLARDAVLSKCWMTQVVHRIFSCAARLSRTRRRRFC